jgi:competence protein ComEC
LRVHFIDIGNGLAMLIETPGDRKHIFVDGGDKGLDDMEDYVRKFVGNRPVDIAIVTHADKDHYYGMHRILDNFTVKEFWNTGYRHRKVWQPFRMWRKLHDKAQDHPNIQFYVPINNYVGAGTYETIDDGGTPGNDSDDIFVKYLNVDQQPPKQDPLSGRDFKESEQRNNASLVIKLIYKNVSFLITGDINGRDKHHRGQQHDQEVDSEEKQLLIRHERDNVNFGLKSTVLQVSHHGSSSLPFLRAVDPEWAVIPAGHKGYDHPHRDTLRRMRLAGIAPDKSLRTDHGDPLDESGPSQKRNPATTASFSRPMD